MTSPEQDKAASAVTGKNGVAIGKVAVHGDGFRTYEVYQRERVGESTAKIKPRQLVSDEFRRDPYPQLTILRENYPCYRDWVSNRYWLTRYDDVTSVFVDDANFLTRSHAQKMGLDDDLGPLLQSVPVQSAITQALDDAVTPTALGLAEEMVSNYSEGAGVNLMTHFVGRLVVRLTQVAFGVPLHLEDQFGELLWRIRRGASWHPQLQLSAQTALQSMADLLAPLLDERRHSPHEDALSAMLQTQADLSPMHAATALAEWEIETLTGGLANMWALLLSHPTEFDKARHDARLMKLAWLETLRHSPPVLAAERFSRHEVERFGRLIPEGALMFCSAAAANRDPRLFADPEDFVIERADLCQREPRGQYRADGLASGIAFGLGRPSRHPAVPEDRPRSRYALMRDTAVSASQALLATCPEIRLTTTHMPDFDALTLGEMRTCWQLPVQI